MWCAICCRAHRQEMERNDRQRNEESAAWRHDKHAHEEAFQVFVCLKHRSVHVNPKQLSEGVSPFLEKSLWVSCTPK